MNWTEVKRQQRLCQGFTFDLVPSRVCMCFPGPVAPGQRRRHGAAVRHGRQEEPLRDEHRRNPPAVTRRSSERRSCNVGAFDPNSLFFPRLSQHPVPGLQSQRLVVRLLRRCPQPLGKQRFGPSAPHPSVWTAAALGHQDRQAAGRWPTSAFDRSARRFSSRIPSYIHFFFFILFFSSSSPLNPNLSPSTAPPSTTTETCWSPEQQTASSGCLVTRSSEGSSGTCWAPSALG